MAGKIMDNARATKAEPKRHRMAQTINGKIERLRSFLNYDPETGIFTWKIDRANKKAGDRAGVVCGAGYRMICLDYEKLYEHHLAVAFMQGHMPDDKVVDHLNQDRTDNRYVNLEVKSYHRNGHNRPQANSNSLTGIRGVSWDKRRQKWAARVTVKYKNITIGRYRTIEEAVAAREAADARYGLRLGDADVEENG